MKILMLLSSTFFVSSNHPISMILSLIFSTVFMVLLLNNMFKSSWFSLIFLLMTLGGMLILFIYVASLASNEKFTYKKNLWLTSFLIILMIPNYLEMNFFCKKNMHMFFNLSYSFNSVMAILYLLISLLIILEMISSFKSPLRSWV